MMEFLLLCNHGNSSEKTKLYTMHVKLNKEEKTLNFNPLLYFFYKNKRIENRRMKTITDTPFKIWQTVNRVTRLNV